MSDPESFQATQTTLRVPPKAMVIGRSFQDSASLMQLLGREGYLVLAEADPAAPSRCCAPRASSWCWSNRISPMMAAGPA